MMKRIVKCILNFCMDSWNFIIFVALLLMRGAYKNKLYNKYKGTVAVLANGPSLKDELPRLHTDKEFENVDFIVLNFFAFEETFFQIKPKHYCLADPMFFQDSNRSEDVKKLFKILETQIDWDLNIYIPSGRYNNFIKFSKLKNKHLSIVKTNEFIYSGFEKLRHVFYRKGLSMPRIQTVANLAIFIGLNSGYSNLRLYGVDHTFVGNLEINDKNQLCSSDTHFYDSGISILKPLIRNDNDQGWQISDYLEAIAYMFKSHDQLSQYAQYLKINIVNCTSCSMIDSYVRHKKK
jgi:hypothetical protein